MQVVVHKADILEDAEKVRHLKKNIVTEVVILTHLSAYSSTFG
jgi:hypothetical protein